MSTRIDSVQVSTFLQDRPGNHSYIENQSRPMLGTNLYNPSDQDVIIVVKAKSRVYLAGQFDNSKYAGVEAKINAAKTFVTLKLPIGGNKPMFNSGKPKS